MRYAWRLRTLTRSSRRWLSQACKEEESLTKTRPLDIRNIGIVAHIDAGKTTLTERMLYLAGVIRHMGDVDSGNTVTDFLDLERERGITIQLAAITFGWRKHRINLIDTPGHVDFTVEVERCARVLDGIVTVLDASSGVQAQTLTVWRQAAKFRLPSVFFVNKMDKKEADFKSSVDSVEQKLGIKALVTASPFHENNRLCGIVDAVHKKFVPLVSDGQWQNIELDSHEGEVLSASRENLCSLVTASPFHENNRLCGIVDAVHKKFVPLVSDGQWQNIELDSHEGEVLSASRENLCCELSELDSEFM
ncbi:GTP-binding domain protein, partial [Cooperia oncophora]